MIRAYLQRHRRAKWIIIGLIVANEIRWLVVVIAILVGIGRLT